MGKRTGEQWHMDVPIPIFIITNIPTTISITWSTNTRRIKEEITYLLGMQIASFWGTSEVIGGQWTKSRTGWKEQRDIRVTGGRSTDFTHFLDDVRSSEQELWAGDQQTSRTTWKRGSDMRLSNGPWTIKESSHTACKKGKQGQISRIVMDGRLKESRTNWKRASSARSLERSLAVNEQSYRTCWKRATRSSERSLVVNHPLASSRTDWKRAGDARCQKGPINQ